MVHDQYNAELVLRDLESRLNRTPYECLGVTKTAPVTAIAEAFADLAALSHPRMFVTTDDATQRRAARAYQALREVYWGVVLERSSGDWSDIAQTAGAHYGSGVPTDAAYAEAITRRLRRSR